MELRDYLAILRKYWVSILLLTILGVTGAGAVTFYTRPTYTAQSVVFLSVRAGDTPAELASGATYAANQVRSYARVATTPAVLQPVIESLGLRVTAEQLAAKISTSIPANTAVIEISAEDADPKVAADIAGSTAAQLVNTVQQLSPVGTDGMRSVNANIVTPASVPTSPTSPRLTLNLALGLLIGALLGLGQAVLRKTLDQRIRTEADVASTTTIPVVGNIPIDPDGAAKPLVMRDDPHSPRAEAYRGLRTNLQFLDADGDAAHKAFVITSSISGEGKTTTAINLATALADNGSSVLLIDADLRRPSVAEYLGIEAAAGLTTVLVGRASLEQVVQPVGGTKLHVLAAGQTPPNPADLLASAAMAQLLAGASAHYDAVLIDSPPLLAVTDAAVIASLVNGALVLVGAGKTTVAHLSDAITTLERAGGKALGVVLNKLELSERDGYYTYRYTSRRQADGSTQRKTRPTS